MPTAGTTGRRGAAGAKADGAKGAEVLIEFRRIGNAVRVTAVDPDTLVEVSIVGAPGAGETALTRAVLQKLDYVLGRKGGGPARRR